MVELSNVFLFVFAGLFPVVNPLGSAPIFLSLTSRCAQQLLAAARLNGVWLGYSGVFRNYSPGGSRGRRYVGYGYGMEDVRRTQRVQTGRRSRSRRARSDHR